MTRNFRKHNGSMLILVVLAIGVIVAAALLGISMAAFLSQRAQSQHKVDSLALAYAARINSGNRVGQMNEMVERSRELVYLSRDTLTRCDEQSTDFLAPLCQELLYDAYQGHELLERERRNQIAIVKDELQQAAEEHNNKASSNSFGFLGFRVYEPKISRIDFGRVTTLQSNVRSRKAISELSYYDLQRGFIEGKSNLFKGQINARLPDCSDAGLDFKFSSLPAAVGMTTSPARNANPKIFVPACTIFSDGKPLDGKVDFMPSAVNVTCAADVSLNQTASDRLPLQLSSTGVTCGACPERD